MIALARLLGRRPRYEVRRYSSAEYLRSRAAGAGCVRIASPPSDGRASSPFCAPVPVPAAAVTHGGGDFFESYEARDGQDPDVND